MHAMVFAPVLITVPFVSLAVVINTPYLGARLVASRTHGQGGSRWQDGVGRLTSRGKVALPSLMRQ